MSSDEGDIENFSLIAFLLRWSCVDFSAVRLES